MSNYIIERNPVANGLLQMLRAFNAGITGPVGNKRDIKGEIGEAPRDLHLDSDKRLIDPYWIIYPMPSFGSYGSLEHPDDGARLSFQITSVGRTDDSATITSDRIRRAILERTDTGSFVRAINAGASMTVIGRMQREFGFAQLDSGRWTIVDTYDLEVQAHA